ncbi:MAG: hypothetical protein WC240_08960 [Bacilli bacterium]|jgi:hypothetical protein
MEKIKNIRPEKKVEVIEKPTFNLPETLICGNKQFKFNDIEKSWLFVQQKLASQLLSEQVIFNANGDEQKIALSMMSPELSIGIIALIYIEMDEARFNVNTYKKRIEFISNNLESDEELEDIIAYFFTNKINSILKGFQSFSKVNSIAPQK